MNHYNTPVFKKDQADDNHKYQPLPLPSGSYPYHLPIETVIDEPHNIERLQFHVVGDTGSVRHPDFQQQIVWAMVRQYQPGGFLYHLGDLVYHHGEAEHYERQFFKPYEQYPGPIFAIAGNHDSDVNPDNNVPYKSLDAFTTVFCDSSHQQLFFSGNSHRKSMVQPNVYWTLETPLATIIGLHSNVPKYGVITSEQEIWFKEELKAANPDKMLIICMHHAPFSADTNHGSSLPMIEVLERAFATTGIKPDIVFSGHVHNYQRFNKNYPDGTKTPFIVAGAGGFDELHSVATTDDLRFTSEHPLFAGVGLNVFCDSRHGFLRIVIERNDTGITLTGDYYAVGAETVDTAELIDSFSVVKFKMANMPLKQG